MSDDTLRIGLILASTRQGRRGERYAKWIHEVAGQRPGLSVELIDLRDHRLPAYDAEAAPLVAEKSYADPVARRWSELIAGLDGYILVTPEYNHGYPGQLKNAIDHVQAGWWYKPVAFVSYGGASGGTRAVEQLRTVATAVRLVSVRGEVNLRLMGLQVDEAGRPTDPFYGKQASAMLDQLEWWGRVAKDGRAKLAPPT